MSTQNKNQKSQTSYNQKNKNVAKEVNILYLLPIMFTIAILPLIVKLHEYNTSLSKFIWFTESDRYFDFFLYYKHLFLIITAICMLVILVVNRRNKNEAPHFSKLFIPLGFYAFLALLSSIFSKYRSFSFTGVFEQFESIFVLLAYCLLVYYAYTFVRTERDVKYIIYALLVSVILLSLLGLSQFMRHDFLNSQMGWSLISNSTYVNYKSEFSFVAGLGRVYLSFYNPNYVGMYVALILPLLLYMTLFTKNLLLRLLFLLGSIGLTICLYGSASTSGFVGVIVSLLLMVVILWKYLLKFYKFLIPIIIILVALVITINVRTNYINNQINKITNIQKTATPLLSDIQTNNDNVTMIYNGNSLIINFFYDKASGVSSLIFKDSNNLEVPASYDATTNSFIITDERYPGFAFTPTLYNDIVCFSIPLNGRTWAFTNQTEDGTYYYINPYGRLTKIVPAPSAVFTGYEQYASGRGYIWSRTFPILKNKIILGSGADTFLFEFPKLDYVNAYNYGIGNELITKPHCLYLQMAVQTGVLSLIAFLIFYIMYFISSFRLYIKGNINSIYSIVGAAILTGSVGYMIGALTNDSSITVAPVFWLLIGIGMAVNYKVKQDNQMTQNTKQ